MSSNSPAAVHMPWGLHLLHDAFNADKHDSLTDTITVDIVVVHGLGAHPDHAWVCHKDVAKGIKSDVRWLTDLLPQTLRENQPSIQARIFCFNYQSAWLGPTITKNRLESIARRLLDDVHHMRIKDIPNGEMSPRPLIFIGHSFGGLVIEQAMVMANSASSEYEYLINLIGGVVLLGTPHQGSKSQKWGTILAQMASLIEYGETVLMDDVDEKSMKVFDLGFAFMEVAIRTDLAKTNAVVCFYENQPTNYLERKVLKNVKGWIRGQTSTMVVEETSAVLPGLRSLVLDSDHLKLNKFTGLEDGNYVSVSSNLARIAVKAPQLIMDRRKENRVERYFLVSRDRVENFVGREEQLYEILSYFLTDPTTRPRCLVLHALGGQGKSQIALEYCRRSRETYRGVFWINASSEAMAVHGYDKIAARLAGISSTSPDDVEATISRVKGQLEKWTERWLLIFDNYDEADKFRSIRQFIPYGGRGDVIFTSRSRDLERLGKLLEIPEMTEKEGVNLLLREHDESLIQRYMATASPIITRLGGLALAIDQASAYIKHKKIPLDRLGDFLTLFEAHRKKVLEYTPPKFWEYGTMQIQGEAEQNKAISAFTTWDMSFEQIGSGDAQRRTAAAHFLTLSAFLSPSQIDESLFRYHWEAGASRLEWMWIFCGADEEQSDDEDVNILPEGEPSGTDASNFHRKGIWSHERFWELIAESYNISLLQNITQRDQNKEASFSLHPLIRDWLQLKRKTEERRRYTAESLQVVLSCIKKYKFYSGKPEQKAALTLHMDICLLNDARFSRPQEQLGYDITNCDEAEWFASFYQDQGQYDKSEKIWRLTVATRNTGQGENHPSTLTSMNNLADVLSHQGRYEQAEEMHRQTLELKETALGKDHPSTLTSMNNLANVLISQGKYEQAEKMHRQTLELMETALGKEHSDTLTSMNNLANVLSSQGKYEQAEKIHRQTLELRETGLGKEHPSTLTSMNSLADVLSSQGKYEQAEKIHRQTLELRETGLGKEHPSTLTSMNNLADVLSRQGKYEQAEKMHRQTLELKETGLGKEHPSTLTSMNNLADVLSRQGKYEQAEEMHRQTLELMETGLGKEHPSTLTSMNNLANVLSRQGKYEQAEKMHRQTLELMEMALGEEHPDTLTSMNDLANAYSNQGRWNEAELLELQVLETRSRTLGKNHPATLNSMVSLAYTWISQDRHEEAAVLLREAAALLREAERLKNEV